MPADRSEARPKTAGRWQWLRKIGPYLVALLVVAAIARQYPPSKIAVEIKRGNALGLTPFAIAVVLASLFLVAAADVVVVRGCVGAPRYVDMLRGKAGAAVLQVVGYAAGHGGYGFWLARVTKAGAALTSGMVLYIMASELAAVCLVASGSLWLSAAPSEFGGTVRWLAPSLGGLMVTFMVVGPFELLGKDRLPRVFQPWRMVLQGRALAQLGARVVQIGLFVLATWAGANAFGLRIPLFAMAAYLPLILVVGSLPVNVAGFGAVQGAWLAFTPWAPGEQILAFQVLWHFACGATVVLRGLPFMRRVVAEIADADSAAPPQS
jgi:hypothetical protein